jgi:hypothetical protein
LRPTPSCRCRFRSCRSFHRAGIEGASRGKVRCNSRLTRAWFSQPERRELRRRITPDAGVRVSQEEQKQVCRSPFRLSAHRRRKRADPTASEKYRGRSG